MVVTIIVATVMIPISLGSNETQSVYGIASSSCVRGLEELANGGGVVPPGISGLQMMLFILLVLSLFI